MAKQHSRPPQIPEDVEEDSSQEMIWPVVYGDFMSYMKVFFLVLFSFSISGKKQNSPTLEDSLDNIRQEFGGTMSQAKLDKLTRRKRETELADRLKELIKAKGLEEMAKIETTPTRLKIVLTAPVLFDSGYADLKPEAVSILSGVADALKGLKGEIFVEGHTDSVPIVSGDYATNWDLSSARANAVVKLFIDAGFDPKLMTGSGYGEYRPVAPNDTRENRSRNRRIEISMMRE